MATATIPVAEPAIKPCLRINELHIEGFRSLRKVDWPADGMGWDRRIPDVVMVGGVNGSGKTTLLTLIKLLFGALSGVPLFGSFSGPNLRASMLFEIASMSTGTAGLAVSVGDEDFLSRRTPRGVNFRPHPTGGYSTSEPSLPGGMLNAVRNQAAFWESDLPSVVFFPMDRALLIPSEDFKGAGRQGRTDNFVMDISGSTHQWGASFEAVLYDARWRDLNAREEGRPEDAHHFEDYARVFRRFFRDTKDLVWVDGELLVKVRADGARHELNALSSGEKQAILLAGTLLRQWRPGSLILIDEPEVHLHPMWQTTLYEMLVDWQKERGGQVIMATHSMHLFSIAEPNTTVLLGAEPLG